MEKPKTKREKLIEIGFSYCPNCKKEKLLNEFNTDNNTFHKIAIYCRECTVEKSKKKYKKYKKRHKNYKLIRDFDITLEQYNEILHKQNKKCMICKIEKNGERMMCVDHCHKSNKVRGLLCDKCNMGLGQFKDNIEFLKNAILYLESNQ